MRALIVLALAACGVEEVEVSPVDTEPELNPYAPTITTCDAWCSLHSVGETYEQWVVSCTVDDIEGLEDIVGGDLYLDETQIVIVCNQEGLCQTSFRAEDVGVTCAEATSAVFTVTIYDAAGNTSLPYEVTGRQD